MVSTCPLISKSPSLCFNPLVTIPSALVTSGITTGSKVFFSSLARSMYLSLFSFCFSFTPWSAGTAKSTIRRVLFLLLSFVGYRSLKLSWPRLDDPFVSQNPKELCASHFLGWILGCAYTYCSYDQIQTSCTVPRRSPFPPSCV